MNAPDPNVSAALLAEALIRCVRSQGESHPLNDTARKHLANAQDHLDALKRAIEPDEPLDSHPSQQEPS